MGSDEYYSNQEIWPAARRIAFAVIERRIESRRPAKKANEAGVV
jgi:hypothetical protein